MLRFKSSFYISEEIAALLYSIDAYFDHEKKVIH